MNSLKTSKSTTKCNSNELLLFLLLETVKSKVRNASSQFNRILFLLTWRLSHRLWPFDGANFCHSLFGGGTGGGALLAKWLYNEHAAKLQSEQLCLCLPFFLCVCLAIKQLAILGSILLVDCSGGLCSAFANNDQLLPEELEAESTCNYKCN